MRRCLQAIGRKQSCGTHVLDETKRGWWLSIVRIEAVNGRIKRCLEELQQSREVLEPAVLTGHPKHKPDYPGTDTRCTLTHSRMHALDRLHNNN